MNTQFNRAIKMTPYEAVFKQKSWESAGAMSSTIAPAITVSITTVEIGE